MFARRGSWPAGWLGVAAWRSVGSSSKHRRSAQLATSAAFHLAAPSRRPLADLLGLLLRHGDLVRQPGILAVDGLNALQVLVVLGLGTAARLAESVCCEAGHSTTI